MTKPNVSKVIRSVQTTLTKHSPEILTGMGIAGMLASTVLAVKATPKALRLLENEALADDRFVEELTPVETVKICWKCYIPAAATSAVSIACLIGASSVSAKRNAALAAAYTITNTDFRDYRSKVTELIGEKKERTVKDKVAEERVKKEPVSTSEVIVTEKGNTLCFDTLSGRYFKSDIDKIKRIENEFNKRLLSEMYLSLNEFYDELGLPHTKLGDDLGWNIDNGLIDLYFSSQIADDGTPCLVLNYDIAPKYGYSRMC